MRTLVEKVRGIQRKRFAGTDVTCNTDMGREDSTQPAEVRKFCLPLAWELRPGSIRLLYFAYINHHFVILHGFRKKTNCMPDSELEKMEPGYQIAPLRIKLGLTQAQLAERVGTKQPSIARLENGEGSPSLSFLEKVAEALSAEVKLHLVPKTPAHVLRDSSETTDYSYE